MKRLEELVQRQLEGRLSGAEERELAALLERDPEGLRMHRQLLDVEVALRDLDEGFDVSEQVMARIAPIGGTVRPAKVGADWSIDWWFLRVAVPLAAAAGMAMAFVLFHQDRASSRSGGLARGGGQASVIGGIDVVRDGRGVAGSGTLVLRPGDRLVAREDGMARFRYGDETEVHLAPGTEVVFASPFEVPEPASKQLELVAGSLRAVVPPQTAGGVFVLKTRHALATVRGTVFRLSTRLEQTRLTVEEGKVDLVRPEDGAKVSVEAGRFAVMSSTGKAESRPQRVDAGLEAFYTFEEGEGSVVRDRSGAVDAIDLRPAGRKPLAPRWKKPGVYVPSGGALATERAGRLTEACRYSGAVTLEAWIQASDTTQTGPAWILGLGEAGGKVDFLLGQGPSKELADAWTVLVRTSKDENGANLNAPRKTVTGKVTHLVFVREGNGNAMIYVDGKRVATRKMDGDFSTWRDGGRLVVGGSPEGSGAAWKGNYRLVAVYSRALGTKEIVRHHESGPDQEEGGW